MYEIEYKYDFWELQTSDVSSQNSLLIMLIIFHREGSSWDEMDMWYDNIEPANYNIEKFFWRTF